MVGARQRQPEPAGRRVRSVVHNGPMPTDDDAVSLEELLGIPAETAALAGTRFVLIRHGRSWSQDEGVVTGHDTCGGLGERGRRQTELLAERLERTGELDDAAVFLTSLYARARQTAEVIAPALGAGVVFEPDCIWCEQHPGTADRRPWSEVLEGVDLSRFQNPDLAVVEGMETWNEVFDRVGAALRTTAEQHAGERIVVACHGGPIGASFVELGGFGFQIALDRAAEIINTSITEWRHDGFRWKLVRFNDAAHLAGVDP